MVAPRLLSTPCGTSVTFHTFVAPQLHSTSLWYLGYPSVTLHTLWYLSNIPHLGGASVTLIFVVDHASVTLHTLVALSLHFIPCGTSVTFHTLVAPQVHSASLWYLGYASVTLHTLVAPSVTWLHLSYTPHLGGTWCHLVAPQLHSTPRSSQLHCTPWRQMVTHSYTKHLDCTWSRCNRAVTRLFKRSPQLDPMRGTSEAGVRERCGLMKYCGTRYLTKSKNKLVSFRSQSECATVNKPQMDSKIHNLQSQSINQTFSFKSRTIR
jgi:hypothetical protein